MPGAQRRTRSIVMLMFEDAEVLDIAGPLEVFNVANAVFAQTRPTAQPPYRTRLVARVCRPVRVSSGLRLCVDERLADFGGPLDTLLIAGGNGVQSAAADATLVAWVRQWSRRARRIASICTGSFLLAQAGLLDGKRATTHWASAKELQRQFPKLTVDADPLFIKVGNVYTSAGVTAGIDLALALVEEDLGRDVALATARALVVFFRRPGGQKQFSEHLRSQTQSRHRFAELIDWLVAHLDQKSTVESLARRCRMSPRHFARLFRQTLQTSPAKFVEQLRLEKARVLMEQRRMPIKAIAASCGFASGEQLRRSFRRHLHINPGDYNAHF